MADPYTKAYALMEKLTPYQRLSIIGRCHELGFAIPPTESAAKSSGAIRTQKYRERLRHGTSPPTSHDAVTAASQEASQSVSQNGHGGDTSLLTPSPVSSKKVLSAKEQEIRDNALKILEFLNAKRIGKRGYEAVEVNLDPIRKRLKEGASVQDCKSIIAMKWREWSGDPEMEIHFCPETIFRRSKFAKYLGQLGVDNHAPPREESNGDSPGLRLS